jgi:hypothetical protein
MVLFVFIHKLLIFSILYFSTNGRKYPCLVA